MQPPNPQTNLSEKITALREQMTEQHNALILKIDEMRGSGPENTLKSINQSLWNIAGPAPGTTLTDLYGLLSKINNGIGGYPDGYVPPGGIPLLNAREYLSQINNSAALLSVILDATGYSGSDTLLSTLKLLLQQFNSSVVYPTMKDLLLTISQQQAQLVGLAADPLSVVPVGVCAQPFVSVGVAIQPVSQFTTNTVTVARWDFSQSTEFEAGEIVGASGDVVIKTVSDPIDWSGYRFYVASEASTFGAAFLDPARHPTNEWLTLEDYHQSLSFTVDGAGVNLKVYICGAGDPVLGACPGSADPLSTTSWWTSQYGQLIPLHMTWYTNGWSGGGTWSQNAQFVAVGETYYGFNITPAVTSVRLCISWDVSSEPSIDRIGIHGFGSNGAPTAYVFEDIIIADSGTIGSETIDMIPGLEDYVNEIIYIPFVAFTDNHTLPPNVTISISWIDLSGMS